MTHQGNRDGSAWSRGQAWGIYGCALSYRAGHDPRYMEMFRDVTDYFLEHLPLDLIPYWDFDFDDPSGEPRDSSSSAIAACGMLEMAKYMEGQEASYYADMAKRLVKALCDMRGKKQGRVQRPAAPRHICQGQRRQSLL